LTIPEPFKFHKVEKKPLKSSRSPYIPLAILKKMVDKTPDRFRRLPAKKPVQRVTKLREVVAHSPKLLTKARFAVNKIARPSPLRPAFKARPVNKRACLPSNLSQG
jgi:hypothetical protein